jgi:hypothetical protein
MAGAKVVPGSPPSNVVEGTLFASRNELCDSGVHGVRMQGIWTSEGRVIGIVLNGGYEDDIDLGDVIVYTGDGGRDPNTGKQIEDQGFTSGNRGLVIAKALKTPIRVTRGWKCKSDQAPAKGFRYDGLYDVGTYEYVRGSEGYFVWRFTLLKHRFEREDNALGQVPTDSFNDKEVVDQDEVSALVARLTGEPLPEIDLAQSGSNEHLPEFEPLHFEGTGHEVIRLTIPHGLDHSQQGAAVLLHWKQILGSESRFEPSFEVKFFTADGTQCTTELSEMWGSEGMQVLAFDQAPIVCEVVSQEKWELRFDRLLTCPIISDTESGNKNSVFRFSEYTSSGKIIRLTSDRTPASDGGYEGGSSFHLRAYGRFKIEENPFLETSTTVSMRQLLSSWDDRFAGERVLPKGTILVEIHSPGRSWSLDLEDL